MLSRDDITARVRKIVSEVMAIPIGEISVATDIRRDLGSDDLDRLEILFRIEEAHDLEVSDEAAETIRTVADLVNHLADRLGVAEAAA